MIIALDYDKTYTADPVLWNKFIDDCFNLSHKVICITMRYPHEKIDLLDSRVDIHYTCRYAKLPYTKKHDIQVDIWIDDSPGWIFDDAASAA